MFDAEPVHAQTDPMNDQKPQGLTTDAAVNQLRIDGPNQLGAAQTRTWLGILLEVVREPMFGLLLAAGTLYFVMGDAHEGLMLMGFVLIIMTVTIVQERRTERVLETLRDLASPRALVVRDGREQRIAGTEVVRGDLLILSEGDRVAADAEVLQAHELAIDESLLTGESGWVPKLEVGISVYAGTLVVRGQGLARVTVTGAATRFGQIGESLATISLEPSPLRRQIEQLTIRLAWIGAGLSVLLAVAYAWRSGSWLDGVLSGITLAMALLPQEFPVILIIFFALGARRIARQGMLTRRLNALETLGKTTVLCVDKTGTLTENQMRLAALYADGRTWFLDSTDKPSLPEAFHPLVEYAVLSCEQAPHDPMELAILRLAASDPQVAQHIHSDWALVREYELSPELMAMTHLWRRGDSAHDVVAAKGAPEAIAALCHLSPQALIELNIAAEQLAAQGMRVLGVARARHPVSQPWPEIQHDFDYEWVGLLGLVDPVRASVPAAIAECRQAGIRVVMITGDHPVTAQAIARQVGIAADDVYARVTPQQKLAIVQQFKSDGAVVAMTGDGVNDAPALKAAHIGIAMGQRGTDVAREAASLVLMHDDFSAIVAAIRSGRLITRNLQQALRYTITVHVPIILLSMLPVLLGLPLLLLPVHIAFMELVFNPTCSLVFEAEPATKDLMREPPVPISESLISLRGLLRALLTGVLIGVGLMLFDVWLVSDEVSVGQVRAAVFTAMVSANLGAVLLYRREWLLTRFSVVGWWTLLLALVSLLLVVCVPSVATLFAFEALSVQRWAAIVVSALILVAAYRIIRPNL